jgi:divalent metal cation (Fe/Co/Zn/Cd) transporter
MITWRRCGRTLSGIARADAIHSLADVANNLVAWFVVRFSQAPADRLNPA